MFRDAEDKPPQVPGSVILAESSTGERTMYVLGRDGVWRPISFEEGYGLPMDMVQWWDLNE